MTKVFWIKVNPVNPTTGATTEVLLTSANSTKATLIETGKVYLPYLENYPGLSQSIFDGELGGESSTSTDSLEISMNERTIPLVIGHIWDSASISVYKGDLDKVKEGDGLAGLKLIHTGVVKAEPEAQGDIFSVGVTDMSYKLDTNLLTQQYAGSGSFEGAETMKGSLKPIALGSCAGVPLTLVEPAYLTYQYNAYGKSGGVQRLSENGILFDAPKVIVDWKGNLQDTYAALKALTSLGLGEWADCPSIGFLRMGGEPASSGVLVADVIGMLPTTGDSPDSLPFILGYLAGLCKVTLRPNNAADFSGRVGPQTYGFYSDSQANVDDVIKALALGGGGYRTFDNLGRLALGVIRFYATYDLTVTAGGTTYPLVEDINVLDTSTPYKKVRLGTQKVYRVHAPNEISDALKQAVGDVQSKLDKVVSDGWLSPSEKSDAIIQYAQVKSAYDALMANFVTLGSPTQYAAARDELIAGRSLLDQYLTSLNPAWNDTSTNTQINAQTYRDRWTNVEAKIEVFGSAMVGRASKLADWGGVQGVGKPDDYADVTGENKSADTGAVGGRPADQVNGAIDKAVVDIDQLIETFGTTEIAAASADAAAVARTAAETARDQSQAARTAAQNAQIAAGDAAAQALASKNQSETYRNESATSASNAAGSSSSASTSAGAAASSATRAIREAAKGLTADFGNLDMLITPAATNLLAMDRPTAALRSGVSSITNDGFEGKVYTSENGDSGVLGLRGYLRLETNNRYRLQGRVGYYRAPTNSSLTPYTYFGWSAFDTNGSYLGNFYTYSGAPALGTWFTHDVTYTTEDIRAALPNAQYVTPLALINYRDEKSGLNSKMGVSRLSGYNATAEAAAAASASAASGSAANAAASQTAAGQSAVAADGYRNLAQTAAGQAETSRSSAATSQSNAAGSANSAASSAALTAVTYSKAVELGGNPNFDDGLESWISTQGSTVQTTAYDATNVLTTPVGQQVSGILGRKYQINDINQKFRISARYRPDGTDGSDVMFYVGVAFYDANNGHVDAADGTGNYPLGASVILRVGVHGWVEPWAIIGKNQTGLKVGGTGGIPTGTTLIPAGAAYFRPILFGNYQTNPNSRALFDYFRVEDVTSEVASQGYATAANSSASTAAAKSDAAGQSASAADTARLAAQTARGGAESARDTAVTAKNDAQGSANSAATNATLSARAASDASGAALNQNRSPGAAPTLWEFNDWATLNTTQNVSRVVADNPTISSIVNNRLRVFNNGQAHTGPIKPVIILPARRYRYRAVARAIVAGDTLEGLIACWDKNGTYLGYTYHSGAALSTTADVAMTFTISTTGAGADATFAGMADVAFARPAIVVRGAGNAISEAVECYLVDVESEQAAANSASAANTSAGSASSSAGAAGASATAANQARIDAQAANGTAQSAASAASNSAVLADASKSQAQSSAALSASFSGGALNSNSNFADFPTGASMPSKWGIWASGGINGFNRNNGTRDLSAGGYSVEGSPYCMVQGVNAGQDGGMNQYIGGPGGTYNMAATVQLLDGSWAGSGILIQALDKNGNYLGGASVNFVETPDLDGKTAAQLATPFSIRRFNVSISLPGGANAATIIFYAMTGWSGFGAVAYKQLAWYKAALTPASSGEVAAGANTARIEQVNQVLTNLYGSVATRVDGVEARAGSLEAATGIMQSAVADLKSGVSAARLRLVSSTPGGDATITLESDSATGSRILFGADNIVYKGKVQLIGADGTGSMTQTNELLQMFDASGNWTVKIGKLN